MRGVEIEPGRVRARGDRPAGNDGVRLGVDDGDLGLVLDVYEHPAGVRHGKLGLAPKRDGGDWLAGAGGQHGGAGAATVEGVDLLPRGLEEDGIGIGAGGHLAHGSQRRALDDADPVLAAVARERTAEFRRDGDAMDARRIGDFADDAVGLGVDNDDLGRMADVEPVLRRIDGEVVPAAVAADGDFMEETVGSGRVSAQGGGAGKNPGQQEAGREFVHGAAEW